MRWPWQSCHGHEELQQGGKGLRRKGGQNVSPESRHTSAPCGTVTLFQPLNPCSCKAAEGGKHGPGCKTMSGSGLLLWDPGNFSGWW